MPTINVQVAASGDDVIVDSGAFGATNNNNGAGLRTAQPMYSGNRFTGVAVGQGATISSAVLTWKARFSRTTGAPILRVYGLNEDNCAAFTNQANLDARALTTASAQWTNAVIDNWVIETEYTLNVTTILQEIVNRAGWVSGNAVGLRVQNDAGDDYRYAYSYDSDPTKAPKLAVTYTGGGGGGDTTPPTDPSNVVSSNITQTSASINWTAATDNIAVAIYNIYNGATFVNNTVALNFGLTGLTANTSYTISVEAQDAAGNKSAKVPVTFSTLPSSGAPAAGDWIGKYPDNTDYEIPGLGTTVVNVINNTQLAAALLAAVPGHKIVLADGTYSGQYNVTGILATALEPISVEAANTGAASFSSGQFYIKDCAYITIKGLSFPTDSEPFRVENSHHTRLTRNLVGPATWADQGANLKNWVLIQGNSNTHHVTIDYNTFRNKGSGNNLIRVYGDFNSFQVAKYVLIHHNKFDTVRNYTTNDKECIRYGVSTMSRSNAYGVIERNYFTGIASEPEVVSMKAAYIRAQGNTLYRCVGSLCYRHGRNGLISDNYIIDDNTTLGSTGLNGAGGVRFYDSGHIIEYNYMSGLYNGNFESSLILDTGDAENDGDALNAHWRVKNGFVRRNVIVNSREPIKVGENYTTMPTGMSITYNITANTVTAGPIFYRNGATLQNSVENNNSAFATVAAAGLVIDGDGVYRKDGYGPRLSFISSTEAGSAATAESQGAPAAPPPPVDAPPPIGANVYANLAKGIYRWDGTTWALAEIGQFTASQITDFAIQVDNNTQVAANTAARHSHVNQLILDAITAAFTTAQETTLAGALQKTGGTTTGAFIHTLPSGYKGIQYDIPAMVASGPQNGSIHYNNTANPGHAISIYSNHAGPAEGAMVRMVADNAGFDKPVLEITNNGTAGSGSGIRLNGPRPEIEFWETDQVSPAGAYEIRVNADKFQLGSRNVGDTAFEYPVTFYREANGGYVGFGTATPTQRIDVNGNIAVSGTVDGRDVSVDGTKLDGVATGATANDTDANLKARANHTGTQSADTLTDGATNKTFLATERTKLTGIATAATANDTDANLKARANHTGTQTAATVSDFSAAADARIAAAAATGTGSLVRATSPALVTPTGIVKGDVGLGNVDNTSDAGKPVSTATQTALNLKAPLITDLDNLRKRPVWWSDFLDNTGAGGSPFIGTIIGSGAVNIPTSGLVTAQHPGVVRFTSSATANSGYTYATDQQVILLGGGEVYEAVVNPTVFTATTLRAGFTDSQNSTAPVDGVYFEVSATGVLSGIGMNNSVSTVAATTLTLTAGTWYRFRITINSTTLATFQVFDDSGTELLNTTITTNIPTAAGRMTGAGIISTNSGTVATDLLHLDYMMVTFGTVTALTR